MSKFSKGDTVVAAKDIGGLWRDPVPAGTKGVVTHAGWGNRATVCFKVERFWSGSEAVEIDVDDEIY